MSTKSIIEANEAYKLSLYNEADMLHAEAVENYEIGRTEMAHDYENRFNNVRSLTVAKDKDVVIYLLCGIYSKA